MVVVCVLRFVRACVVAAPTRMLRSVVVFGRAVFLWSRSERAFGLDSSPVECNGLGSVGVDVATVCLGCLSRSGGIPRYPSCIYLQSLLVLLCLAFFIESRS